MGGTGRGGGGRQGPGVGVGDGVGHRHGGGGWGAPREMVGHRTRWGRDGGPLGKRASLA